MVWKKPFAHDDPVFQFWRATAHIIWQVCAAILYYLVFEFGVDMFWSDFAGNITTVHHVRSTYTLCFQMAACLDSFYEIVRPLSAQHHPQPNTKPLPLQGRLCSPPNSGSSKQSSLWGLRPGPDRRNPMDLESSSSDRTLGHLIPRFLLENFSSYWTKGWGMDDFGMQYVSFNIKFAHICSRTALERYLPKKNLNCSQSDHHKTTREESRCIYRLTTLRSTKIHFSTLQCIPFRAREHLIWVHFQVTVSVSSSFLYALFLPTILTKHQAFTPSSPISFCPKFRFFRVEFSLRPSAKAWQEKSGPWVQLLNWSNSESSQSSLLENLSSRGMKDEAWEASNIKHC